MLVIRVLNWVKMQLVSFLYVFIGFGGGGGVFIIL